MPNFCERCGSPLNTEGECPNCDKTIKKESDVSVSGNSKSSGMNNAKKTVAEKPVTKKDKKGKGKTRKIFIWVMVLLALYSFVTVSVGCLVYFDKIDIPFVNDIFIYMGIKEEKAPEVSPLPVETTETAKEEDVVQEEAPDTLGVYEAPVIDADEYYGKYSNVVSKSDASSSANTLSESAVYELFEQRGFADVQITTHYDMDGNYSEERVISKYSSVLHPTYNAIYTTPSGNVWVMYCTDGKIMAMPLFLEDENVMVVLSETDTITSYDNVTNKFFVNTPNTDVAKLLIVETIDSQTLDQFTME